MKVEDFRTRDADVLVNIVAAHLAALHPRFAHLSTEGRNALVVAVRRLAYDCAELRALLNTANLEDANG